MNQNSETTKSPWILCPSKSVPGKFYYFNVLTGAQAWCEDFDKIKHCSQRSQSIPYLPPRTASNPNVHSQNYYSSQINDTDKPSTSYRKSIRPHSPPNLPHSSNIYKPQVNSTSSYLAPPTYQKPAYNNHQSSYTQSDNCRIPHHSKFYEKIFSIPNADSSFQHMPSFRRNSTEFINSETYDDENLESNAYDRHKWSQSNTRAEDENSNLPYDVPINNKPNTSSDGGHERNSYKNYNPEYSLRVTFNNRPAYEEGRETEKYLAPSETIKTSERPTYRAEGFGEPQNLLPKMDQATPMFGQAIFPTYLTNMPSSNILLLPIPTPMIVQKPPEISRKMDRNTQTSLLNEQSLGKTDIPVSSRFAKINNNAKVSAITLERPQLVDIVDKTSKPIPKRVRLKSESDAYIPTDNPWKSSSMESVYVISTPPKKSTYDVSVDKSHCPSTLSSYDLRLLLNAKKKRKFSSTDDLTNSEDNMKSQNEDESNVKTLPKRVRFSIEDEDRCDNNDVESDEEIDEDVTPSSKLKLHTDRWYVIVDSNMLIDEFEAIDKFVLSDKNCRLLVTRWVKSEIAATSFGDCGGQPRVIVARKITRKFLSPPPHYVFVDDLNNPLNKHEDVLSCCIELRCNGYDAVIISNDPRIQSEAKSINLQCLKTDDLKNTINSSSQTEITFDLKKMKLAIPNDLTKHAESSSDAFYFPFDNENNNDVEEATYDRFNDEYSNRNECYNKQTDRDHVITKHRPETDAQNTVIRFGNEFPKKGSIFDITVEKNSLDKTKSARVETSQPSFEIKKSKVTKEHLTNDYNRTKMVYDCDVFQNLESEFDNFGNRKLPTLKIQNKNLIKDDSNNITNSNIQTKNLDIKNKKSQSVFENQKPSIFDDQNLNMVNETSYLTSDSHSSHKNKSHTVLENKRSSIFDDQNLNMPNERSYLTNDSYSSQNIDEARFKMPESVSKNQNTISVTGNQNITSIFEIDSSDSKTQKEKKKLNELKSYSIQKENYEDVSILDCLERFYVKNDVMYNRITNRFDEFVCSFLQIIEDTFTQVLAKNKNFIGKLSPRKMFSEIILGIEELCLNNLELKLFADKFISLYLSESDDYGKLDPFMKPDDFMKLFGCGVMLIQKFKESNPSIQELADAEKSLLALQQTLENSQPDCDNMKLETPKLNRLDTHDEYADRPITNFVKKKSDIVNYLKAHFNDWKNYTEGSQPQEVENQVKIVRTVGNKLGLLQINTKGISLKNSTEATKDAGNTGGANEKTTNNVAITKNSLLKSKELDMDALDYACSNVTELESGNKKNDSNMSIESTSFVYDIKIFTNKKDNAGDVIEDRNDVRPVIDDVTVDSGFENESLQAYSYLQMFLTQLSESFKAVHTFIEVSVNQLRNDIEEDAKCSLRHRANKTYYNIANIIEKLNTIIHREGNENTTLREIILNAGLEAATDKKIIRYRQVITKCLEQAKILKSAVKTILLVTGETCQVSVSSGSVNSNNKYFNIFE